MQKIGEMDSEKRFQRQLDFILEVDKLKHVLREAYLIDHSRRENDAEHSWHISLMAVLLAEYAETPDLDLLRVVKMLLIHDLVEIDAGDTFAFDEKRTEDKAERESRAAERIFSLLPDDQAEQFRALWEEFESSETPEARFALSVDRIHPMIHNYFTQGRTWRKYGVKSSQVLARAESISRGSEMLGQQAKELILDAEKRGYFSDEPK